MLILLVSKDGRDGLGGVHTTVRVPIHPIMRSQCMSVTNGSKAPATHKSRTYLEDTIRSTS